MYFGLMLPATYFYVLFNHEILIQIIPLYFMAFAMLSRCFLLMRVDVAKYPNFRLVLTVMNTTLTTNWHYSDIWCMLYFLLIDIIKRKIINFTIKSYDYLVLWKVAYSFGQILETNKCILRLIEGYEQMCNFSWLFKSTHEFKFLREAVRKKCGF